jgi:hypothetical protein
MLTIFILLFSILIYLYLIYNKSSKDTFTVIKEIPKPKIRFDINKTVSWLNYDMSNIKYNLDTTEFNITTLPFYSNKTIFNERDEIVGFFFTPSNTIKDFRIGLTNIDDKDLKKNINDLDFSYELEGDYTLRIKEKINPILEDDSLKDYIGSYNYENIDYCFDPEIEICKNRLDTYIYDKEDMLGILIDSGIINYVTIRKNEDNTYSSLLLHRSKNRITLPLKLTAINDKQINKIKYSIFLNSTYSIPEAPWSVELLNKYKYDSISLPIKKELNQFSPAPVDEETVRTYAPDYSFEREINIKKAILSRDFTIVITTKTRNINQDFMDKLYGISIYLFNNEDKDKKLTLQYIKGDEKIELTDEIFEIKFNIEKYYSYFYKKGINIEMELRRGEFTNKSVNIISEAFAVDDV